MRIPLQEHPVIAFTTLLIMAMLVWGFWPQPILVEAVTVKRAPLSITIEEEGRTRLIDRYVISAPIDGVACRVQLNVGDPVQQDEWLLGITPLESPSLDPRSRARATAQVAAAKAAFAAATQQVSAASAAEQLARNELDRLKPLVERGLVSREAFDRAATEATRTSAVKRSADFQAEVAGYELKAAQTTLDYSAATASDLPRESVPIRSPIPGQILKVSHECEGPVSTGQPLLEIGDPSALEIEVDVLSADAVKIKSGMKVLFDRWGGDGHLEGMVRIVEPVGFTKVSALGVEEQRVLIISDFTSPPERWQRLGDGYRVEARFIVWQEDDVLQVPSSSLFRYEDGWALFLIEHDRAKRQRVKVGQRNGLIAQILEGVEEADQVIDHPTDEIEHGIRVKRQGSD